MIGLFCSFLMIVFHISLTNFETLNFDSHEHSTTKEVSFINRPARGHCFAGFYTMPVLTFNRSIRNSSKKCGQNEKQLQKTPDNPLIKIWHKLVYFIKLVLKSLDSCRTN